MASVPCHVTDQSYVVIRVGKALSNHLTSSIEGVLRLTYRTLVNSVWANSSLRVRVVCLVLCAFTSGKVKPLGKSLNLVTVRVVFVRLLTTKTRVAAVMVVVIGCDCQKMFHLHGA